MHLLYDVVRGSICRPWLLCEVLYKYGIKTWFLPWQEWPFPYQSWWQSYLSESKQTVRQHQCERQQFHHLRNWTAFNRHSSKNRAELTTESRILLSGCVLSFTQWSRDGMTLNMLVERGEAGPFTDLRTWFTSCVVLSAPQLPSISPCKWEDGHLAPFRKSLYVAESGSFQKV